MDEVYTRQVRELCAIASFDDYCVIVSRIDEVGGAVSLTNGQSVVFFENIDFLRNFFLLCIFRFLVSDAVVQ